VPIPAVLSCLIAFGWSFVGFMLAAARYGSIVILENPGTGPRWWGRVALACLPVAVGVVLIGLGVWLLARGG
jgi:hypothetical protein